MISMTAGAFLTCEPMVKAFGLHEMKNKAEAIRRVWPDFVPKGKDQLNPNDAAYFIYVFASTYGIKDIHDKTIGLRIWSCAHSKNDYLNENALTFIGGLIHNLGEHEFPISNLQISKRTGIVNVIIPGQEPEKFVPELKGEIPTYSVEEFTIIRRQFFAELGKLFKETED